MSMRVSGKGGSFRSRESNRGRGVRGSEHARRRMRGFPSVPHGPEVHHVLELDPVSAPHREAELSGEAGGDHVLAECQRRSAAQTGLSGAGDDPRQEQRPEAAALPGVGDRDRDFRRTVRCGRRHITHHADDLPLARRERDIDDVATARRPASSDRPACCSASARRAEAQVARPRREPRDRRSVHLAVTRPQRADPHAAAVVEDRPRGHGPVAAPGAWTSP